VRAEKGITCNRTSAVVRAVHALHGPRGSLSLEGGTCRSTENSSHAKKKGACLRPRGTGWELAPRCGGGRQRQPRAFESDTSERSTVERTEESFFFPHVFWARSVQKHAPDDPNFLTLVGRRTRALSLARLRTRRSCWICSVGFL
jgi:hypothetical protein